MSYYSFDYLENIDNSPIGSVWNATNTLLRLFQSDTQAMLGNMKKVQRAYDDIYAERVRQVLKHVEKGVTSLQQFYDVANRRRSHAVDLSQDKFVRTLWANTNVRLILLLESLENLNSRLSTDDGISVDALRLLPKSIYDAGSQCSNHVRMLNVTVHRLAKMSSSFAYLANVNASAMLMFLDKTGLAMLTAKRWLALRNV
jgi:hypothetical protein